MGALMDLAAKSAEVNEANGWTAIDRSFGDDVALLHSEVSEAFEEYRKGRKANERYYTSSGGLVTLQARGARGELNKPEGIPSELADVLIRLLDTAYRNAVDLDAVVAEKIAFNATRGNRHGGKIV